MKSIWNLLKATFNDFMDDKAMQLAAALAFYTIFSLGPVLIIVISIAGLIWGEQAARGELVEQFRGIAGDSGAQQIEQIIERAGQHGGGLVAGIVGFVTLIIGATGVFGQLKGSLNTVWEVQPKPGRGVIGVVFDRLLSFGMVLAIAFLLMATLVGSAVISATAKFMGQYLPVPGGVLYVVDLLFSIGIISLLFAAIFKWLPDVKIEWRDVWMGAFVTALLFAIGKFALGLYLGRSSVASVYGAAGSLIVILLWVYYSALIFLFGAEFTQVYAQRHGKQIEPADYAKRVRSDQRAARRPQQKQETHKRDRQPQRELAVALREQREQTATNASTPTDRLIEGVSRPLADYLVDVVSHRVARMVGRSNGRKRDLASNRQDSGPASRR